MGTGIRKNCPLCGAEGAGNGCDKCGWKVPGSPLRFPVGTYVMAMLGPDGYEKGVVIQQWDDGNPYRIRILEDGIEVHGPVDRDTSVMLAATQDASLVPPIPGPGGDKAVTVDEFKR